VLRWRPCHHGFQCATARVPLSYRHPRGSLISIAVIRHRATGKSRAAGGPAAQIQGLLADYPGIPPILRERFDIITFDPRGFGLSSQLRCFATTAAENWLLAPVQPFPSFRSAPGTQRHSSGLTPASTAGASSMLALCLTTTRPPTRRVT
jgi:pimeloyl-ACP methyl ester carboxylesterase